MEPAHPARIVSREGVGGGLALVALAAPSEVRASLRVPGQYVEVRSDGEAGYFAVANERLRADAWEVVVRGGGGAADALLALPIGAEVSVTRALGDGFPCDEARGRRLLVAVVGSGIGAARPVMARRLDEGDAAATTLLVGVRSLDVPFARELARWRDAGARALACVARSEENLALAPGYAAGYVQEVARTLDLEGGMIFAADAALARDLADVAPSIGVDPRDVRTNH